MAERWKECWPILESQMSTTERVDHSGRTAKSATEKGNQQRRENIPSSSEEKFCSSAVGGRRVVARELNYRRGKKGLQVPREQVKNPSGRLSQCASPRYRRLRSVKLKRRIHQRKKKKKISSWEEKKEVHTCVSLKREMEKTLPRGGVGALRVKNASNRLIA